MSQGMYQNWFEDEILDGLSMVFVLGLPNTPAAESVTLTAKAWSVTLWNMPIGWERDSDIPRIQKTFVQLMGYCDRFPTPKQFHELIKNIERKQVVQIGRHNSANRDTSGRGFQAFKDAATKLAEAKAV